MKSPYSTTLLGLAAIAVASTASAFVPAADSVYFPGRMTGIGNAVSNQHATTERTQKTLTPTLIVASSRQTNNMELIDQLKHDVTVIFSIIDSDASGSISKQEFCDHLQQHQSSSSFSESFVDQLFDRMDLNGDGAISESEFRTLYLTSPSLRAMPGMGQIQSEDDEEDPTKTFSYETLIEAGDKLFASLDTDGNGFIDFTELKSYVSNLGRTFQDKAMIKIFNLLDGDGDLSIGRDEFRDAYWRYSAFRKALGEST